MIYGLSPLPFSVPDTDKPTITPAIPPGQESLFLPLLVQSVAAQSEKTPSPQISAGLPVAAPMDPEANASTGEGERAMKDIFRFVFGQEGDAYVAHDGGSESSRYGILQATASQHGYVGKVGDMTRPQAEDIYRKMWEESGAKNLPPSLALVHFDTFVNSPAAAKKMLRACGGDVETYLQLRSQRYARLSELRPARYAKYTKGWMNRIQSLRVRAAAQATPASPHAST